MARIAGVSCIRTNQKNHVRSITGRRRSKFLTLFMLDNERQLLEKDNEVLQQRQSRNTERIEIINQEIEKSVADEFNSATTKSGNATGRTGKTKKWKASEIKV